MAQAEKSRYYRALKDAGVSFEKHYRDYTTQELKGAYDVLAEKQGLPPIHAEEPKSPAGPPQPQGGDQELRDQLAALTQTVSALVQLQTAQPQPAAAPRPAPRATAPAAEQPKLRPRPRPLPGGMDPNVHAGVTQNSHDDDEIIEVDAQGNQWYQKEVAKPGFPKPRGRRVLRYEDPGVKVEEIKVGEYTESFEVAGDPRNARPSEIKITLPSFQTGIYKAPNMPFRIHTYNGVRGFDMVDVQKFYGAADLVPDSIKRCYVSTDLCYDIRTTIRAIEDEYRERVLKKGA